MNRESQFNNCVMTTSLGRAHRTMRAATRIEPAESDSSSHIGASLNLSHQFMEMASNSDTVTPGSEKAGVQVIHADSAQKKILSLKYDDSLGSERTITQRPRAECLTDSWFAGRCESLFVRAGGATSTQPSWSGPSAGSLRRQLSQPHCAQGSVRQSHALNPGHVMNSSCGQSMRLA